MRIGVHLGAAGGDAGQEGVDVLLEVISERSHGMVHDDVRVAQLARQTARRLGVSEAAATRIEIAGRLHDIGEVAIPDEILHKPERLSDEEWDVIRTHPEVGARIIGASRALADVAALVRAHHERYDGSGYPDGLRGKDIPLGASIISVCDAFVAMMRQRPFTNAITVVEAIAELQRGSGSQFDPRVVEAFQHVFDEFFK